MEALDKLTVEQLLQEKTAVQRGLLYLEGMFGRPSSKEERDLARSHYDRYRQIKRMLNRNSSMVRRGIFVQSIGNSHFVLSFRSPHQWICRRF